MTKLDELVHCLHHTHVYVQMHNYPDQDALASAMGLQILLKERNIESTIIFHGIIDRDNTRKMIELLNISLWMIEEVDLHETDEIIIVDGQKGNINMKDNAGEVVACIDHHNQMSNGVYRFQDIRNNVGSCSSIITEYFIENDIPLTDDLATALFYGLRTDTAQLTRRVNKLDIRMFCHLVNIANQSKLRIFEKNSICIDDLGNYQKAISRLLLYDNIAFTNIGNNCSEAIIGIVNDFLLTIKEIEFTVIYSFRDGGIKFSVRSAIPCLDASNIIHRALCGLGDGGGHNDMAAGFIPSISDNILAEQIATQVQERIILLVHNYMDRSEIASE